MNYPRAFRILRGMKGLKNMEFADLLGVHESYISLIESGKREPGRRLLEKLSAKLGVPIHLVDLLAADKADLKHIGPESAEAIGKLLLKLIPE